MEWVRSSQHYAYGFNRGKVASFNSREPILMPTRERVADFIATVVSNDHVRAIEDYYHDDATMQENGLEPRQGKRALIESEAKSLARLQKMHTHPAKIVLIDGDHVAIRWIFDATRKDGITYRLEEVALQIWRGDRIAQERFFYDTATAWTVV
jgi:ketosteroid isomerase-like protein